MRTDKCKFTIGITKGYFHDNENNINFISLVDKCARDTEKELGKYISFCISSTITLYKTEWGCPENGENTYTLSAIRNPRFDTDSDKWKECCLSIVKKLKTSLEQSTVTVEFDEVDMVYFSGQAVHYYY